MTNTKINFCGVEFKNPIVTASGTFGFGMEYNEFVSIEEYGGFGAKGLTRVPSVRCLWNSVWAVVSVLALYAAAKRIKRVRTDMQRFVQTVLFSILRR